MCEADQMLADWKADILALGDPPVDSAHAINAEEALDHDPEEAEGQVVWIRRF